METDRDNDDRSAGHGSHAAAGHPKRRRRRFSQRPFSRINPPKRWKQRVSAVDDIAARIAHLVHCAGRHTMLPQAQGEVEPQTEQPMGPLPQATEPQTEQAATPPAKRRRRRFQRPFSKINPPSRWRRAGMTVPAYTHQQPDEQRMGAEEEEEEEEEECEGEEIEVEVEVDIDLPDDLHAAAAAANTGDAAGTAHAGRKRRRRFQRPFSAINPGKRRRVGRTAEQGDAPEVGVVEDARTRTGDGGGEEAGGVEGLTEIPQMDHARGVLPESTVGGTTTCSLCFVGDKDHLAVPCGHLCACMSCARDLEGTSAPCPICRQCVNTWVRVRPS